MGEPAKETLDLSALKWLTLPEACIYARMSKNTLKKYLENGHFSGERLDSGHWRIDRESIDGYFGETQQKALVLLRKMRL